MNIAQKPLFPLKGTAISALREAETLTFHCDFCQYLELKEMLHDASALARRRFRILFANFYGMNAGGVTEEFKARYFELLFDPPLQDGRPDFAAIVNDLGRFKNRKGLESQQFSFVSKLLATHCEASPIYDRHVRAFFEINPPAPSKDEGRKGERLKWAQALLRWIEQNYVAWAQMDEVAEILELLKERDPRLRQCHDVRLIDFLVWKVGNQKIMKNALIPADE